MSDVDGDVLTAEKRTQAMAALKAAGSAKDEVDLDTVDTTNSDDDIRNPGGESDTVETNDEPVVKAKPKPTELPVEQQLKLRLRQEMQRHRAAAQNERVTTEKIRMEMESELQKVQFQKASLERQMIELQEAKKRAKETPESFLSDAGTSLEEIVRGKLEEGKPDARISNLERQIQALVNTIKDQNTQAEENKKAAEAQAVEAKKKAEIQALQEAQNKAEMDFLKLTVDGKEEYPALARLTKRAPQLAIAQAYAAHGLFKTEHGREPSLEEIATTVEKFLGGEDETEEKPKPGKRTSAITKTGTPSTSAVNLADLSDEERIKLARRELRRITSEEKAKDVES